MYRNTYHNFRAGGFTGRIPRADPHDLISMHQVDNVARGQTQREHITALIKDIKKDKIQAQVK